MESTIKDDSSKESHNAGSTADEHAYVHLYPRLDGTGPLGPPDMTGLNGRMPMQSHVPPPGGPRFMYPPVPQNVWYPQMQPHNMYANYPENTPYLAPPQPPGPAGQFPMQYFNPMPYPLNYPTSNAPLAVPSEFKPHPKPKPDDKNAHADKKQTRLNKKIVINEPFEEEKADGSDPSAQLLLRGVPKGVSRDVLELFLENKNRSGGGSVKELTLNKRLGVAYVTFEDFRDAENVLRKAKQSGALYLPTSKCDLEVIRFEETQHAHYFNEIPHTSVFVKNIAVDSSDETLKNYFEVRCKAKPTDVIRSLSRKTALFEFEDTIDISSMTRAFGHNRLEGNILDMIVVQETRQVKVTGVNAGTSPQVLKLYFDNHARSKGGEVQTVEKVDKDNSCIVTFVNPEDARQVAHAPHILDGLKLSANLYNALLDTDPDSVVTIPEVVDVSGIDQNIVRYVLYYNGLSEQCLELLGSVEMQEIIRQRLSQKDILAVCSRDSREIFTFELTSGDADHAVKVVKRCVTEFSLDLTDEQIQCLETDEGAHFIKQIMGEHQGLLTVVILRTGRVQVTCLYSLCRDIENEVETFVESNARYELFIRVHPEVFRCINMHARYALTSAEKEHDVTITKIKEKGNDGYRVAGKKTSAQKGVKKVEEVCKHVIKHEVSVEWPGFDKYLQSQNGKYDLSQVEQDEKCLIVFPHQQEERQRDIYDRTDKPSIGIKIVAEGSIVYQKVDVIVNATNQKLDMSVGVVSQQLLKVAGAELQTECTRKYPNGIKFGKVAKTTSGKMKHCKAIIHGTLPRWTTDNAQKVLENLMTECLKTADQDGYTTIAFPALGTGRCEYPSDVVADTLIKSVMEYENDHPDTNIRCVSFVIWSKDVETIKALTKTKEEMSKRQKQKDRRRTEPDSRRQTQTTALTVYTNKPQNIRRIESRIKEFRKEDEIFPPASLLEQLTDDRMEVVKKIARENKTKLVKTDKSLKMIGYGNSVKLTKTKVESYMDNVEKDLKLTLQSLKAKGAVSFPASWSKTDITDPLKIVNLAPTDPDYVTVSAKFLAETRLSPANIVKIERIQNPALYGQYFAKKKHMESAGGVSNEKMLWHGTRTPEVAAIIQKKGFDRNYNHGAAIGVGVYFAVNANMSASGYCSPDKMGHKYIFHACVLTGDSGVGSGGIRFPPPKVPGNPLITFDSTCDNVANPSMFAVFHDAQAYPSFMITFK